ESRPAHSLGLRVLPLVRDAGKLGAELIGVDAIGAHHGADERVVQHLIERQFIMAKSHLLFSFLPSFVTRRLPRHGSDTLPGASRLQPPPLSRRRPARRRYLRPRAR